MDIKFRDNFNLLLKLLDTSLNCTVLLLDLTMKVLMSNAPEYVGSTIIFNREQLMQSRVISKHNFPGVRDITVYEVYDGHECLGFLVCTTPITSPIVNSFIKNLIYFVIEDSKTFYLKNNKELQNKLLFTQIISGDFTSSNLRLNFQHPYFLVYGQMKTPIPMNFKEKLMQIFPYFTIDQQRFIALTHKSEKLANKLVNLIARSPDDMYLGVSTSCHSQEALTEAFQMAQFASNSALQENKPNSPIFFSDLRIEILNFFLSASSKERIRSLLIPSLNEDEFHDFRKLLFEYFKYNGSVEKASKALHVHKNTLIYRLNKIYKETGYNPRHIKDGALLYLLFSLDVVNSTSPTSETSLKA